MAEIQASGTKNRKGQHKRKKLSTRVDLTPMVDLGFLLITFFIFTTTMSEANAMKVIVPSDEKVDIPVLAAESKTISLLLDDDNKVYYYHGREKQNIIQTDYSAAGVRAALQKKIQSVNAVSKKNGETIVLIKPAPNASYRNLVDILDEMQINGIKRYVLMEAAPEEIALLKP